MDSNDIFSVTAYAVHVAQYATDPLDELMNGMVKDYLGIPRAVRWGGQSGNVFNQQAGDFMKDNVDTGMKLYCLLVLII